MNRGFWISCGAMLLAVLSGIAFFAWRDRSDDRLAQFAYVGLLPFLTSDSAIPECGDWSADLPLLLETAKGREYLKDLDGRSKRFAYDEKSESCYFVHLRRGGEKSCIGSVSKLGSQTIRSHAGLPSQLDLIGASIEKGEVVIEVVDKKTGKTHFASVPAGTFSVDFEELFRKVLGQ